MADAHVSPAKYVWIWVWLAGLMLLGVALSEWPILPLPRPMIVLTVLGLSTVKAVLVAWYYMHLKFDRRWLIGVAAFPLLLLALAVLLGLSSVLVKL